MAKIAIGSDPGAAFAVSRVLGHSQFHTTLAHYFGTEGKASARHLVGLVTKAKTGGHNGRRPPQAAGRCLVMPRSADPERRALPPQHWPAVDRTAWVNAIADGGTFESSGPAAHWRPRTRSSNIQHYGRWLT